MQCWDYIRVVLVEPTHPGNIGATARAMANFGARDLRLVNPRRFPHPEAEARAASGAPILAKARVCESLNAAVGDCVLVLGASAREREIAWPTLAPDAAASELLGAAKAKRAVAMVFGRESSGLTNAEIDACHKLVLIPTDPAFASLNLGAAATVMLYELRKQSARAGAAMDVGESPATADELRRLYCHLQQVLQQIEFCDGRSNKLQRRLARLFNRAQPDAQETRMLRGILTEVQRKLNLQR